MAEKSSDLSTRFRPSPQTMAEESSDLSTRMLTKYQNTDQRRFTSLLFSYFKKHKVQISSAIKKTFPFLETLRDRGFISEKLYEDCQESCRNLVPVQKVVYHVLVELEKKADWTFLKVLFSNNNMREYPGLRHVLKNGPGKNTCQSLPWSPEDSSAYIVISSDDSNDEEELPGPSTSAWKRGPVKERGNQRIQMLGFRNPSKRGKLKGRRAVNSRPLKGKRRVPRVTKKYKMLLQEPEIPVRCGRVRGILHQEKMKQGSNAKCVKTNAGNSWITLQEFEAEGGREASKNWRRTVRFEKWTLEQLIQKGYLSNPPVKRRKQAENRNICEVCHRPGELFCCDTCPRSFHQKCHIQPIDPSRDLWSCIFCQIREIQRSAPETQQHHEESSVLKRPMMGVDKLKCQFLLLKIFSSTLSAFFTYLPYYSKQSSQGKRKFMWLDRVKQKFYSNLYSHVETFVLDMRLIFQNHREYYRGKYFLSLGLRLERKFEEDFQSIFAIRK